MPKSTSEPYISFIAASRNDTHGGNLLRRTQVFVSSLAAQCDRHNLPAELVLVEWNPPSDRAPLAEVLQWPTLPGRCGIRILTVDAHTHSRLPGSDRLPLFQMIAKNVGIRRAHGSFVAATNIDIVFSDQIMASLARQRLRSDRLYRADRWDCDHDVPLPTESGEMDAVLDYCRRTLMRRNGREGTLNLNTGVLNRVYPKRHRIIGHVILTLLRMLKRGLISSPAGRHEILRAWRHLQLEFRRPRLHTNACGDFTMVSRDAWFALRGYAEWAIYSFHLDSALLHSAAALGLYEECFDGPIYHIEHSAGSGFTPEHQGKLWSRLQSLGLGVMTDDVASGLFLALASGAHSPCFNGEDWGLAGVDFQETVVRPTCH